MEISERNPLALDYILHPRSVAVAGASNAPLSQGQMFLMSFHNFGLKGNVYPVHPKESEVGGLKCYPSVKDIPGPVDYVFGVIPARFTPQFMEDCVVKGVKVVSFFTAGFSESGEAEGEKLEAGIECKLPDVVGYAFLDRTMWGFIALLPYPKVFKQCVKIGRSVERLACPSFIQ